MTISFSEGAALSLDNGGSISAVGTSEKQITFRGTEHSPGFWTGLLFATNSSQNRLSYVVVEDAGESASDQGAVQVRIDGRLSMDHTTIRNSAGNGLLVMQAGVLSHFEANHFEQNAYPYPSHEHREKGGGSVAFRATSC